MNLKVVKTKVQSILLSLNYPKSYIIEKITDKYIQNKYLQEVDDLAALQRQKEREAKTRQRERAEEQQKQDVERRKREREAQKNRERERLEQEKNRKQFEKDKKKRQKELEDRITKAQKARIRREKHAKIQNPIHEQHQSWIITIPKHIEWNQYQKEIDQVKDGQQALNYRVPFKPTAKTGEKCFIVHNGYVKGYMKICNIIHYPEGFKCSTTGKEWPPGYYIQRAGSFHKADKEIPMKGFRGIRRYNET